MERKKRQYLKQILLIILIGIIIGIYINTENSIDKFINNHKENNKEIYNLLNKSLNLSANEKDKLIEDYLQTNQKRIDNLENFKIYLIENKVKLEKESLDVEKYISEINEILSYLKQSHNIVSKKIIEL
jgi:hypothetical protein